LTIAALSPALDLTYTVASLQVGKINRTENLVGVAGGKALNCARAAHELGAEVQVVALLGGSTGRMIADQLRGAALELEVVSSPEQTRTCVSIAATADGQLTELYQQSMPANAQQAQEILHTTKRRLTGLAPGGWVACSGSVPAGLGTEMLPSLRRLAHDQQQRFAVDSYGPAMRSVINDSPGPDLIKINRSEAAQLLEMSAATELPDLAAQLAATSATVIITDGAAGAYARAADGSGWRVPPPTRRGQYSVGSGDSFMGGLLWSLDTGADLPEALRWAAACGMANAAEPGAARFSRATAAEFAAQIEVARA